MVNTSAAAAIITLIIAIANAVMISPPYTALSRLCDYIFKKNSLYIAITQRQCNAYAANLAYRKTCAILRQFAV